MTELRCNWINEHGVQCGQPLGHTVNHGNGYLTSPRDTWHEFIGKNTVTLTVSKLSEPFGVIYHDKSIAPRCLWQGPHGRCIYEQNHTIQHKEETNVDPH
jgi:hypothetical protein